jgi:hypothetical protein
MKCLLILLILGCSTKANAMMWYAMGESSGKAHCKGDYEKLITKCYKKSKTKKDFANCLRKKK